VRLPPPEPAQARIVDPDQLSRLVAELPEDYRVMPYLGAMLGMQIGEVLGLRVGRLDLLARAPTLTVAESLGEADGVLFTRAPKNDRTRVLPLPPILVELLAGHLARRGLNASDRDELVFVAQRGGPIRRPGFRSRIWAPACRRAGLDRLGFHDLRRSAATVMLAQGTSVRDAAEILGHDPRMTLVVYAPATEAGKRQAADGLAAWFRAAAAQDRGVGAGFVAPT
jgi:integrase